MNLVRYAHVQKPRLRYTVAYNFKREGDKLEINYGIAQCSKEDTFTRAEGRNVAEERLRIASSASQSTSASTPALRLGTLVVKDTDGLNVSKTIREHFEAQRKAVLNNSK